MKPTLRLSFLPADNTYYHVINNAVSESSSPFYLNRSVENWNEIGIVDERNMRYGALSANASEQPYSFVKDGAKILRYHYYTYGIGKKLQLKIEKLNATTQEYELMITTHVDWASFKDERDRVLVTMLEDSIATMIKNRENIEYPIAVTGPMVRTVRVKEQYFPGEFRFLTMWPPQDNAPGTTSVEIQQEMILPLIYADDSTIAVNAPPDNKPAIQAKPDSQLPKYYDGQTLQDITIPDQMRNNFLIRANVDLSDIVVSGSIAFGVSNGANAADFKLRIRIRDEFMNNLSGTMEFTHSIAGGANDNFTLNFTSPKFTLAATQHLIITIHVDDGTGSLYPVHVAWEKNMNISVSFTNALEKYTVTGLSVFEVMKQVVNQVSDGKASFKSNLLSQPRAYNNFYDLDPSKLVIASENSIVNYPNAKIRVSLKTMMDALSAIMGAGMEVNVDNLLNQYVSVEEKDSYFKTGNSNLIADLGEVSDCIMSQSEDIYTDLKVGYKVQEYSGTSNSRDNTGRYEYNTLLNFKMPTDVDNKTLELISPIRADGLGMYNVWANYNLRDKDRTTRGVTDTTGDTKLFILQVTGNLIDGEDTATFAQDIKPAATVTGLIKTTDMLNPGLTPARNLLRNGKWLNSLFFAQDSSILYFISSELSENVQSTISAGYIAEKANRQLTLLAPRVHYPIIVNFKTTGASNYIQAMKGRRAGFVRFTWQGAVYEVFLTKSEVSLAKPEEYGFKGYLSRTYNPLTSIR